jgi:hypothetical protein
MASVNVPATSVTYLTEEKKMSLHLIKHNTMKMYGGMEVQLYAYLTPAHDEAEWSPLSYFPQGKSPSIHWI